IAFLPAAACLLFAVPCGADEPAEGEAIPFLTPDEAIRKMTYPEGFEVTAFAAEPNVVQPFAFTFDERGRIWLLENLNYETRGSDTFDQGPKGRIVILEDKDGDGRMDERKVFLDRIFFPSGIALGYGGVWIGSPPNLLFIPDADRDDKPDGEPRVVLDGWGRDDRHETLNSFLWGPDGWLYGCHGVFTHSRVGKPGTPDSERVPINAGVWRYHPVREVFEVFAWGTSNPWGLDFDDHGQAFIIACVIPHLWHIIQGGRYQRQSGPHFSPYVYDDLKTIADHRHASAHGGARFYLADAFPERYRGRLFMCNIHQHDVIVDNLERRGSGFVGKHGYDFLQSNDAQWLGFNMEVGPEGAIYIIDWHDADICGRVVHHEETGRIWRIAYEGTKASLGLDLTKRSDAELVELHLHPNDWHVRQARRLLHERAIAGTLSAETKGALRKILDTHAEVPRKLRALWTLHLIGGIGDADLVTLLGHESEYLRAWAVQLLCEDRELPSGALADFARLAAEDPSAFVRLYLASACQRLPIADRWDILRGLVSHEADRDDHNLPLMIWYALEPAVAEDSTKALEIARGAKVPNLVRYVTRRIAAEARASRSRPVRVEPAASVSSEGLIAWHRADWGVRGDDGEIARWIDRADRGRDGSSEGDLRPRHVEDLSGRQAIRFDGKDDRLVIAHDATISFNADDAYTASVWVHVEERQPGWRAIIAKSREASPWWGIWIDPEGRFVYGGHEANIAASEATRGWHHVAIVQDPAKGRHLYVDGALVASGDACASDGPGDLWIGGAKGVSEFFRGAVSEIRVYRRALTHPEIAHLAAHP
ncbi:MAG TPA: PVC-type heme-binding CxxCH protein, partial [Planctomycetota bacterium]|nr:PVC-type heme-binding CxxCH protein [Planctomycetota bacterium]